MPSESSTSGWEQYNEIVLQQLENLSVGIEALRSDLLSVKEQLIELKVKEDKVQDLKIPREVSQEEHKNL